MPAHDREARRKVPEKARKEPDQVTHVPNVTPVRLANGLVTIETRRTKKSWQNGTGSVGPTRASRTGPKVAEVPKR